MGGEKVQLKKSKKYSNLALGITKTQYEIFDMLVHKFKTPDEIAFKRKTTVWAVYKIIKKLQQKGLVKKGYKLGGTKQGGYYPKKLAKKSNLLRLHNIQLSISILENSKKFFRKLKQSNKVEIGGTTIMVYQNHLDIYTQEGVHFFGSNTDECYNKAINFFSMIYSKIESDFDILIDKERYLNKKWVRQHIAETNNEIATKANKEGTRINIKDKTDGKTAIITDNSFKLNELEFIHPTKAKQDTDNVIKQLEDFRENNPVTITQLSNALNYTQKQLSLTVQQGYSNAKSIEIILNFIKNTLPNTIPKDFKEHKQTNILEYIG